MSNQVDQAIARDRVIRLKLQKKIREKYPEKLAENLEALCKCCQSHRSCHLVPVTSNGDNCPYWDKVIASG